MKSPDCRDCIHHSPSRSTYWPKLLCRKLIIVISAPKNRLEMTKEETVAHEKAKACPHFQTEKDTEL